MVVEYEKVVNKEAITLIREGSDLKNWNQNFIIKNGMDLLEMHINIKLYKVSSLMC
jgi:hypothetical protein